MCIRDRCKAIGSPLTKKYRILYPKLATNEPNGDAKQKKSKTEQKVLSDAGVTSF